MRVVPALTGFHVVFPDGEVIADSTAASTFARAIDKIGLDRVEHDHFRLGNEELVSDERSKKYPSESIEVTPGRFVLTHSDSQKKKEILEQISKRWNLNLRVELGS